ncbi:hypothetical protein [Prevotella sp. KH2C16]|uniref:hypothetical protein n=1 Tax=Prevotella sp. KH2C16 TaxID=1855325 RepID=UPI0008E31E7C|nr:hypothetical protein [Prevotella sp. KH2C16]SFG25277.1 hypothetical protein SAMN05216383_10831 [Prevotella sp. KH2C16]
MRRLLSSCLILLLAQPLAAQRQITVYDLDSKKPLRAVRVWTNTNYSDTTDYLGHCLIPQKFDTLVVSKPGYLPSRIPYNKVTDTIPLLSNYNRLDEVVVYGEDKSKKLNEDIKGWTYQDPTEYALQHPVQGFNPFGLAFFLVQKASKLFLHKHRKAPAAITEDPILKAYKDTQEELKAQGRK